jgi:hypothetical protein
MEHKLYFIVWTFYGEVYSIPYTPNCRGRKMREKDEMNTPSYITPFHSFFLKNPYDGTLLHSSHNYGISKYYVSEPQKLKLKFKNFKNDTA